MIKMNIFVWATIPFIAQFCLETNAFSSARVETKVAVGDLPNPDSPTFLNRDIRKNKILPPTIETYKDTPPGKEGSTSGAILPPEEIETYNGPKSKHLVAPTLLSRPEFFSMMKKDLGNMEVRITDLKASSGKTAKAKDKNTIKGVANVEKQAKHLEDRLNILSGVADENIKSTQVDLSLKLKRLKADVAKLEAKVR